RTSAMSSRLRSLRTSFALLLLASGASAQGSLPDIDVRPRSAARASPGAEDARERDERALRARIPFLRVVHDPFLGTPRWIASTARFLTDPVPGGASAADAVLREFVGAHRALFGIAPEELLRARRTRDFAGRSNGARHLTFRQTVDGLDV